MMSEAIRFSINPDIVCDLITRAKEFQAKEAPNSDEEIPNSEYEYDWSTILEDRDDDMTYIEVEKTIEDLEPDQKVDLLALMYIGRGDFESTDWSGAHKEAKNNIRPHLAKYLLAHPQIASFLEKGLEILGYSCNE